MGYRYDINKGIQKIKTRLFVTVAALGLLLGGGGMSLAVFGSVHADEPGLWQLNAPASIVFSCGGGNYDHTLNTVNEDQTGAFTGTGMYNADNSYTWNISGNVSTNNLSFTIVYNGSNAGYTLHGNGSFASDGSASGTVDNNCQTFSMPAGSATFSAFSTGNNLKQGACSLTKKSTEVVDVTYKLINDYDSGVGGNAWANDTIHRHLIIWNVSGSTYCAIVRDNGTFITFAGESPNGTGTVGDGVKGDIQGGYRTVAFSGDFIGNANYATHGNLGTYDLVCTSAYTCPGAHPAYTSYFSTDTPQANLAWWGWGYDTCQNGSWINSIDANTGDITGSAPAKQGRCEGDSDSHHHDNDQHHDQDQDSDNHDNVGPSA